ncbi:hypothetical protein GLYMA_15G255051v4 [Glycine max]|nr:hypothetical protein GLYMA_15G255051v4 [Glycine max]KAH1148816.1 hypothetical protein GYH30_043446 [Glycine max]
MILMACMMVSFAATSRTLLELGGIIFGILNAEVD